MTRELIPDITEGVCEITSTPTHYKYNGSYIHPVFLTSANKLCSKYPEKTFDEALEIILSAEILKKSAGEDALDPKILRTLDNVEPITWTRRLKKLFKK